MKEDGRRHRTGAQIAARASSVAEWAGAWPATDLADVCVTGIRSARSAVDRFKREFAVLEEQKVEGGQQASESTPLRHANSLPRERVVSLGRPLPRPCGCVLRNDACILFLPRSRYLSI